MGDYSNICELRGRAAEGKGCTRLTGLGYCAKRRGESSGAARDRDCTRRDVDTLSFFSNPYPMRLEWAGTDTYYVVQRMPDGTGNVDSFSRGTGAAADSSNAGPPYLKFRPFKKGFLLDYSVPVTGNVVWITDELGGMDLVAKNAAGKFCCSFHGDGVGGVLYYERILIDGYPVVPGVNMSGSTFELRSRVRSTADAAWIEADMSYIADAGGIRFKVNDIAHSGITLAYFAMPTATGGGYTDMLVSYGGYYNPIKFKPGAEGMAFLQSPQAVKVRNPATGYWVSFKGDMAGRSGFVETRSDKELATNRTKTYGSAFTDPIGLIGASALLECGRDTPGEAQAAVNLVNPDWVTDWATVNANGTVIPAGNSVTMAWGSGTSNLRKHAGVPVVPGYRYVASVDVDSINGGGTREFYIGSAANGGNTTPPPAATTASGHAIVVGQVPLGRMILVGVATVAPPDQRFAIRAAATSAADSTWSNPYFAALLN